MTPMPNAPNPNAIFGEALARTPAPLPLSDIQQQMAQTAGLNAQVPIQQQTAQELALKNQLTQRTVKNLQLMHDNLPGLLQASGGKYDDSVFNGLIGKGVDPDAVEKIRGDHYMHDETMARTKGLQLASQQAQNELNDHASKIAAKIAVGLGQTVQQDGTIDPVKLEAQLQNAAIQDPNYDVSEMRALATKDPQQFKARLGAALATRPDIQEEEEAAQQKHIQTGTLASEAQLKGVAVQEAQFKQRMREYVGAQLGIPGLAGALTGQGVALNSGVSGHEIPFIADAVSREIDRTKRPADWQEAYGAAVNQLMADPNDTAKVFTELHKVAERGATERQAEQRARFEATDPEIVAAKRANEIATRVGVARSMAGTGPFSSITDQAERNKAIEASDKLDNDFADKVGAARQLRDFVAAAQSGNEAAPGLIPIAEVRQLVNRVNRQELQSVSSSAGSAWDRIQGKIGSLVEGQPIPPEVLRDINTISGTMENAAGRTYDLKRQALGRNHGIAPPPRINVPATETPAAASETVPLITTKAAFDALPHGATYKERDGNTYRKP